MSKISPLHISLLVSTAEALSTQKAPRSQIEAFLKLNNGSSNFRAGTYVIRMAVISGTATSDIPAALQSWVNAALKRLDVHNVT